MARLAALVLALVLGVGLAALSRGAVPGDHRGEAALRLTWRVRGEEIGQCRRPTEAELAELPPHMRNPDACVGSVPPYRLTAEVDGSTRVDETVEGAGARGDRPLYVYRELFLEPGTHTVRVAFVRQDADGGPDAPAPGGAGPPGEPSGATARSGDGAGGLLALELDQTVELAAGQVLLITRDEEGRLVVRRPEG